MLDTLAGRGLCRSTQNQSCFLFGLLPKIIVLKNIQALVALFPLFCFFFVFFSSLLGRILRLHRMHSQITKCLFEAKKGVPVCGT